MVEKVYLVNLDSMAVQEEMARTDRMVYLDSLAFQVDLVCISIRIHFMSIFLYFNYSLFISFSIKIH
jgi:hypothetical protein